MNRHRHTYAFLIGLVILLGLTSRSSLVTSLPSFITTYSGDTFWALMIFLILGFLFPRRSTFRIGVAALVFSFSIEASQLYRAEWILQLRETRVGALVLGSGFLWSDLVCYTSGTLIGMFGENVLNTRKKTPDRTFKGRQE